MAAAAFQRLVAEHAHDDALAYVWHKKPSEKHTLRGFHSDVFLSLVLQVLSNEDTHSGHPLYVGVGPNQYRELHSLDVPWVHFMLLEGAVPVYPIADGVPAVFVFRYFTDAQRAQATLHPSLELALPGYYEPRPPTKRVERRCLLPQADTITLNVQPRTDCVLPQ